MNQNNMREEIAAQGRVLVLSDTVSAKLVYDFGAIRLIEAKYGSMNGLLEELAKGESAPLFTLLGYALWVGTSRKTPFEEFEKLLQPKKLAYYYEVLAEVITESMGSDAEVEPGKLEAAETAAATII